MLLEDSSVHFHPRQTLGTFQTSLHIYFPLKKTKKTPIQLNDGIINGFPRVWRALVPLRCTSGLFYRCYQRRKAHH